jgi:hypothetical protein
MISYLLPLATPLIPLLLLIAEVERTDFSRLLYILPLVLHCASDAPALIPKRLTTQKCNFRDGIETSMNPIYLMNI